MNLNSIFILAASLLFYAPVTDVHVSETVDVSVVLDVAGTPANAVESTLVYDPEVFDLVRIEEANSMVTLWIDSPQAAVGTDDGQIHFSGVNPAGFGVQLTPPVNGVVPGTVFIAVFKAQAEAQANFSLNDTRVLSNDGTGTALPVTTLPLSLNVQGEGPETPIEEADLGMPEPFTPLLSRDAGLFDGQWFLSFSAIDREGVVDHYEVREGLGDFERAESPYVLKDQNLRHRVWVKAVDSAGNERTVQVSGLPADYRNVIAGASIALVVLLGLLFWKRRRMAHLVLAIFLMMPSGAAMAATEYLSPAAGDYDRTFVVTVYASTDQALNAVSGTIDYPAGLMRVSSISKSGSIVNLWPVEPSFSNATGTISFEGVVLNPGYLGSSGKVLSIVFVPIKEGSAVVTFKSANVLANDGNGTSILTGTGSGSYALKVAPVPAQTSTQADGTSVLPAVSETSVGPAEAGAEMVSPQDSLPDWAVWEKDGSLVLPLMVAGLLFLILVTLVILRLSHYELRLVHVRQAVNFYRGSERLFGRAFARLRRDARRQAWKTGRSDLKEIDAALDKLEKNMHESIEHLKKLK